MFQFNLYYPFIFIICCTSFFLPFINSMPISENDSPYGKFVDFLSKNNCTMPKEVQLPFPSSSDPPPFNYLDTPLKECQTSDALKENSESNLLCREVFDVLQNITCFEDYRSLPKIDSGHLSENVCNDFKTMQNTFPKQDDYLSGKLWDSTICKVLCTTDKYELLCKTLLWSYDTQAKIKSALENEEKGNEGSMKGVESDKDGLEDEEKENEGSVKGAPDKAALTIKVHLDQEKPQSTNQEIENKSISETSSDSIPLLEDKSLRDGSDLNDPKSGLLNSKINSNLDEVTSKLTSSKTDTSTSKSQIIETISTIKNVNATVPSKNESDIQKSMNNENVNPVKPNKLNKPNQKDVHTDQKLNEIDDTPSHQSKNVDVKDNNAQINLVTNANNSTLNSNEVKDNQSSVGILQNKENDKDNINNDIDVKTSKKPEENINSKSEIQLKPVKPQEQENETKIKQTGLKTDTDHDKEEKPKLTDFNSLNEVTPDTDSKLSESSTVQIIPDEDGEPHQEDKDQDQYNDTENESDYSKAEYDNSFNIPPKNTEPDVKSSIDAGSSQISNSYDPFISQRNNIGHVPDGIPVISSFPEQEDSHFFFYFLSIVLILMAGYLIFHNKQKIIALIVEGRHERRRRSHGAGYKKLETK